jgi:hypothetical protein
MSTGLGTGEPICAICGTPFDSHLKCRNGHPLFKAQDIVLEVPINRETLLADEPLGVRETGHSTSDELFKNVHYERTKTNYETIKTKTPICLSQRETSRRDFTFGGIATAVIGGAIGGPIGEAVFDERKEARAASITEQELIDFQGTEHDREKLAGWLENLEKDKGKPSLQGLIRSQIAILDGSNLLKLEIPSRLLSDS